MDWNHYNGPQMTPEQIHAYLDRIACPGPIPSMRSLAKSIHVSVITVQKAYEDLQRDGFIETTVGRGSFVSAQNKDFYQEEQQRQAEEHLQQAADIGRTSGIPVEKLVELLRLFYEDQEV